MLTPECASNCISRWRDLLGPGLGAQDAQDQAGEFYGVVYGRDHLRGVLDGLAAEADCRDEGRGDEQRAFQAVVRVWRLGHGETFYLFRLLFVYRTRF